MDPVRRCASLGCAVVLVVALATGPATADREAEDELNAASTETIDDDLDELEDLVVTARRRPELLRQTPVTATVFSGELLEKRGIDSLEGLDVFVPNLTAVAGVQHAGTYYVRGVGQRDAIQTLEPGVGI
jgi:iron complex outermembrane receptor protein